MNVQSAAKKYQIPQLKWNFQVADDLEKFEFKVFEINDALDSLTAWLPKDWVGAFAMFIKAATRFWHFPLSWNDQQMQIEVSYFILNPHHFLKMVDACSGIFSTPGIHYTHLHTVDTWLHIPNICVIQIWLPADGNRRYWHSDRRLDCEGRCSNRYQRLSSPTKKLCGTGQPIGSFQCETWK